MKKILCYIGIILLLFLAFLPPLLRVLLPNQAEEVKEEKKEQVILSCSNGKHIVNTSYENDTIQMIVWKQFKENNNLSNEEEDAVDLEKEESLEEKVDTSNTELDLAFSDLKDKSNVTHNILEDGEVIVFDFSISNYSKLNLTKFTQKLETQKEYYESQTLSCIVRE